MISDAPCISPLYKITNYNYLIIYFMLKQKIILVVNYYNLNIIFYFLLRHRPNRYNDIVYQFEEDNFGCNPYD